jgi:pimeloyl-ACP methyl ester carboxylesterase
MHVRLLAMVMMGWLPVTATGWVSPPSLRQRMETVQVEGGTALRVEAGVLRVPESRLRPTARRIEIPWYRLTSTAKHPAAPIFLLAGGPGASGLDQMRHRENFEEAMFYRSIADVIVFDQRGAGHARPAMNCPQEARYPAGERLDWTRLRGTLRNLLAACRDQWQRTGVDLAAYNTVESAADVDALRQALGYRSMTLVGGSYGSHLALQVMRRYPGTVERAVLYGVEGPDQTWDDPDGVLAALRRIARSTGTQAAALGLRIPDGGVLGAWSRVLQRLQAGPRQVMVKHDGRTERVVVDAELVRLMIRHKAGSHDHPGAWPEMILAMDRGDFSQAARAAIDYRRLHLDDPMHWSMDCASGISEARRRRYERAPAARLLGDINREYAMLCDVWPARDLGKAYRANVVSSIPTLVFQGTWDVSTPLENARETVATLRHGQLVTVVGGNHGVLYNLYDHWPPMRDLMQRFLSGQAVQAPARLVMPWVAASLSVQP